MKNFYSFFFLFILSVQTHAQTWQPLNLPTTQNIKSSSFINDNEGWIGFDNANATITLYHTSNGGSNWNPVTVSGAGTGTSYVDFADAMTGYVVIAEEAFKTIDGGNTWTQLDLPGTPTFHPCFLNPDTGFIISTDQFTVHKTSDGGSTWNTYTTDFGNLYQIKFYNDSIGTATEYDGYIYQTSDGGVTWSMVNDGGLWSYFNGTCYAPDGKLYYTGYTDFLGDYSVEIYGGPAIYSSTTIGELIDIRFFSSLRGYAAGWGGQIVKTENAGLTWEAYNLPAGVFYTIDGFNDIYVFGSSGKAFKLPYYCALSPIFDFSVTAFDVVLTDVSLNAGSWFWDFGDGATSNEQNPVHAFQEPGTYDICLTITNDSCGTATLCQSVVVCAPNSSVSMAGSLDVSFGNGGIATDIAFVPVDKIASLAIQPDGKIIAGGYYSTPSIARYNADGTPDSSFAGDGAIDNVYISYNSTEISKTKLLADGRIILGGIYNQDDTQIIAFMPDGNIDSTFGNNGSLIIDLSKEQNNHNNFVSMAIQPDGKIIVYGYYASDTSQNYEIAVARVNNTGIIDSTFSGDGIAVLTGFADVSVYEGGLAIQPDGKILLCGLLDVNDEEFALIRLNADGSIDNNFGNAGLVTSNITSGSDNADKARVILIQPDNKIIAIGVARTFSDHESYAAARYLADGSLDNSFGNEGKIFFQIEGKSSTARDAVLQDNGKILIAGWFGEDNEERIGLVRLNTNGEIDSTFGNNGIVITQANCDVTLAFSIALDGNKIYVGGNNYYGGPFMLARYWNDCPFSLPDFTYALSDLAAEFTSPIQFADWWLWDFGDGTTSTDQNPVHEYGAPGSYEVCLQAGHDCGTDTFCQTINIIATSTDQSEITNSQFAIFPNPFSPQTTIQFSLTETTAVSIGMFDMQGRKIKTILKGNFSTGNHSLSVDASSIAKGIYLLQMISVNGIQNKKLIVQ